MRTIEYTTQFKKDYKREKKSMYRSIIDAELDYVVDILVTDRILPTKYYDHALGGKWLRFRDCHIKPDLVLIYKKPNDDILILTRVGSHSELGL